VTASTGRDRLQRLHRVLDQARAREQAAYEQVRAARDALSMAQTRLNQVRRGLAERTPASGRTETARRLADAQRYADRLRRREQVEQEAVERARAGLEQAITALTEAGRRRLAVEKLTRSHELQEHIARQRSAQAEIDEHGNRQAISGEE